MINKLFHAAAVMAAALFLSCSSQQDLKVKVSNDTDLPREFETVELDFGNIIASHPELTPENVVVYNAEGKQVPSQVYTEDYGMVKLLFQVSLDARKSAEFTVKAGEKENYDTLVYSRYVPERMDDYAYENNRIAGRVYGPALKDPRTLGPDIWLKRVEHLVINTRYRLNDYHHDHGDGMDCYKVGNTLGGGACAPVLDGKIILGENYEAFNTLCNGPIRTKAVFRHKTFDYDGKPVTLKRELSLDANSWFVKISNWFDVTADTLPVVLGAIEHDVISREDGDHYIAFTEKASDSKDPDADGNISVGLVVDSEIENVVPGTVDGHAVLKFDATPGKRVDVWTGSGWSKGGVRSPEAWAEIVKDFAYAQANPLKVEIE